MSDISIPAYPSAFDEKVALNWFWADVDLYLMRADAPEATRDEIMAMWLRRVSPSIAADLIQAGREIDREAVPVRDPWYRRLWQWLRSDGLGRETARQGRG